MLHFLILAPAIMALISKVDLSKNCSYANITITPEDHCPRGYFFNFHIQGCKACSECPEGFGVECLCGPYENTRCKKCERGVTYSARTRIGRSCIRCTRCAKLAHVKSACNETSNTVCQAIPKDTNGKPTGKHHRETRTLVFIIIIISIFSFIVLIALVFVCRRVYCRNNEPAPLSRNAGGRDASLASDPLQGSSFSSLEDPRMRRFKNDTDSIQSSLISNSGSERPSNKGLRNPNIKLSDLPGVIFESIGKLLNPVLSGRDWESLAGRLNFTPNDIGNFKLERANYTERVLTSYIAAQPNATIDFLHNVFLAMERRDAARVLFVYSDEMRMDTPV